MLEGKQSLKQHGNMPSCYSSNCCSVNILSG